MPKWANQKRGSGTGKAAWERNEQTYVDVIVWQQARLWASGLHRRR